MHENTDDGDSQIDDSIERLFDALDDLNRIRGRREALKEVDLDYVLEMGKTGDVPLADVWEPSDAPQLRMALRHIDAARELVIDELDKSSPSEGSLDSDVAEYLEDDR